MNAENKSKDSRFLLLALENNKTHNSANSGVCPIVINLNLACHKK